MITINALRIQFIVQSCLPPPNAEVADKAAIEAQEAPEAAAVAAWEKEERQAQQKAARAKARVPIAVDLNKEQHNGLQSMLERPSARGGGRKRKLNSRYEMGGALSRHPRQPVITGIQFSLRI